MSQKFLFALDKIIIKTPSWDDVRLGLLALPEKSHNLTLALEDDSQFLHISGGKHGLVTVGYFNNLTGKQAVLINLNAVGIEYEMVIGNQTVPIADNILVSFELAERALFLFFNEQSLFEDEKLNWKIQDSETKISTLLFLFQPIGLDRIALYHPNGSLYAWYPVKNQESRVWLQPCGSPSYGQASF